MGFPQLTLFPKRIKLTSLRRNSIDSFARDLTFYGEDGEHMLTLTMLGYTVESVAFPGDAIQLPDAPPDDDTDGTTVELPPPEHGGEACDVPLEQQVA